MEGMNNEHIVSSGIYYYDSENVSSSFVSSCPRSLHLMFILCPLHPRSLSLFHLTSDTITESRLDFRVAVGEPDYEQNDSRGVSKVHLSPFLFSFSFLSTFSSLFSFLPPPLSSPFPSPLPSPFASPFPSPLPLFLFFPTFCICCFVSLFPSRTPL